ncbi:GPR1/FUN34/yaaH family protein [Desulfosarcina cetonica]|uniref:acetate uptake transporter family protein n=1 Tax=Desulfosarcina cetonica TaxID=90730 RepID=UPI0006D14D4A|nr:GPR1/FUN34/YaaH family transporter [Desulfosarcina cetonica]VTR65716.1 GPR1/FUN34/yaaH family protein [Desulfosarcina cetonica]
MSNESHSFASPAPQALGALAIACFIFFGLLTGRIGEDSRLAVACWLFGGFVCQFVAAIIELKDKSLAGGNVMLLFSSFFMLVTALVNLAEFICHAKGIHFAMACDPYAWLVLAIVLSLFTPAYLTGSPFFFVALLFADAALWFLVMLKFRSILPPPIAAQLAAYCILMVGIFGIYLATANIINTTFKKTVFPVGKPLVVVN